MNQSSKLTALILATLISLGFLWSFHNQKNTGTVTFSSQLVSTTTPATSTIRVTGLQQKESKQWQEVNLRLQTTAGQAAEKTISLPIGTYSSLRLEIDTPETVVEAGEIINLQDSFTLPTLITVAPDSVTDIQIRIPLEQSLFSTTEADTQVFLPRILYKSTITKNNETRLLEILTLGTTVDAGVTALFSYPTDTVFPFAEDGTIKDVNIKEVSTSSQEE